MRKVTAAGNGVQMLGRLHRHHSVTVHKILRQILRFGVEQPGADVFYLVYTLNAAGRHSGPCSVVKDEVELQVM